MFRPSVLALLLAAGLPAVAAERVEFHDATLYDFVQWSSTQLKRSFVVGADIRSAPVSVLATYDSADGLERLLQDAVVSAGFHFSSLDGVIRISSQPIRPADQLQTEVLQLQHLQSDFAYQAVRDVLASAPADAERRAAFSVTPSPTSNAVIVTATREQIAAARAVLAEIDRPRRQVVITAVVAEISDDDLQALGLDFSADAGRLAVSAQAIRGADYSSGGFSLTFDGPTLGALLRAVRSTGHNRILSTPQLMTLNRESASIVVGQNVPFVTGQTTSGSTPASDPFQTITRQDVGVSLAVTPFITPADSIELKIEQSASSVSDDTSAADIITNTRRISTTVQLQDGQGLVLGGLRSQQSDSAASAVPLLSSVPVLGRLFRSDSDRSRSSTLVVLLSARIHKPGDVLQPLDVFEPIELPVWSVAGGAVDAVGGTGRHAPAAD